jgi:alkyl hydroperoxide reductase subunit F
MLEQEMIEQLKELFSPLESQLTLLYRQSRHPKQGELIELLEGVAQSSARINVRLDEVKLDEVKGEGGDQLAPHFEILKNDQKTGVSFTGIPGGHEFSSLILAILNADGKGKMPDDLIKIRIKNLKGKIKLKTYISLTCENCPDVVQSLNQMALIHESFSHEMVDGADAEAEILKLGIQGVPSVVHDGKLIHSGKIQFLDLLTKLETYF